MRLQVYDTLSGGGASVSRWSAARHPHTRPAPAAPSPTHATGALVARGAGAVAIAAVLSVGGVLDGGSAVSAARGAAGAARPLCCDRECNPKTQARYLDHAGVTATRPQSDMSKRSSPSLAPAPAAPAPAAPAPAVGRPVDDKRQRVEVPEVEGADPVETEVTTKTTYKHRPPTDEAETQTDADVTEVADETCNGPPSMRGRSHAEVTVTSHLLEALFGTAGATLGTLWAALRRGDRFERSDAAFELADGLVVLFEWGAFNFHSNAGIPAHAPLCHPHS